MCYSKSFGNKIKTLRLLFLIQSLFHRGSSKEKNLLSKNNGFFPSLFFVKGFVFVFRKKSFFFVFLFETFLCLKKTTVNPLRNKNPLYFMRSRQKHVTFSITTCRYKLPNQISFLNWLSKQKWIKYIVKTLRIDKKNDHPNSMLNIVVCFKVFLTTKKYLKKPKF